jgi:UDP-glucose 4-epimerase
VWITFELYGELMRILITGGAGYIGTTLVQNLAREKQVSHVIVYDNFSRKNYSLLLSSDFQGCNKKITLINGDILDGISFKKAIKDVDVLIHLAAKVTTPFANIDHHQYDQVNHWGTAQVARICSEFPNIKIIFASSASVYGHTDIPISERENVNPDCHYGISKYKAEQQLMAYCSNSDLTILRIGNVYGINESFRLDSVVNKFLFAATTTNLINIDGDGNQIRPIVHVSVVAQVITSVIKNNIWGEIFNLFSENISINKIAEHLINLYKNLEVIYVNQDQDFHSLILEEARSIDKKIGMNLTTYNIKTLLMGGFAIVDDS